MKRYRGIIWIFVSITLLLITGYILLNDNTKAKVIDIRFISDNAIELDNGYVPVDLTMFADSYKGEGDDVYISRLSFKRIDVLKNGYDEFLFKIENLDKVNRKEAENVYSSTNKVAPTDQMTSAFGSNQVPFDTIGKVCYYMYLNKDTGNRASEQSPYSVKEEIENKLKNKSFKAHTTKEIFILLLKDVSNAPISSVASASNQAVVSQGTAIEVVNAQQERAGGSIQTGAGSNELDNNNLIPRIPPHSLQRPSTKKNLITWNSDLTELAKKITITIYCTECDFEPTVDDVTGFSSYDWHPNNGDYATTPFVVKLEFEFKDSRIKTKTYSLPAQLYKCRS
jgi:hypothetical protein